MTRSLIITLIIFVFFKILSSSEKINETKITEAKLTYSISGTGTHKSWEFEVLFNNNNTVVFQQFARGASQKLMLDKISNEILALNSDKAWIGVEEASYFTYHTPERVIQIALSSNYGDTLITQTNEYKDILGFNCRKSVIKHGNQAVVEVWTTDLINPGLILPWTPLAFADIALEYEFKVLGEVRRRYVVNSISTENIDITNFDHNIPEDYMLIVPASVFSIDEAWSEDYEENPFESFTYPFYKEGRETTIDHLKKGISNIITLNDSLDVKNSSGGISLCLEFIVDEKGNLSDYDISINFEKKDERIKQIEAFLKSMDNWSPGKVRGKPVKSKVLIFG